MAVYTKLNRSDVEHFLASYSDVGTLIDFTEITAGIENSNYFVEVSHKGLQVKYVLTLFENMPLSELPFFSSFTQFLMKKSLPVPAPVVAADGSSEKILMGKPAVLVPCMPGKSVDNPNLRQCEQIAQFLGRMHRSQEGFDQSRELVRDLDWMKEHLALLENSGMDSDSRCLLVDAISEYEQYFQVLSDCPKGLVHGDLFRDNVLFSGEKVTGVIDFYHACRATFIFDLAVLVNDWAWNSDTCSYDQAKMDCILKAYRAERAWSDQEYQIWSKALELAALRFWISRLVSAYVPSYQNSAISGAPIKDPNEMKEKLIAARAL